MPTYDVSHWRRNPTMARALSTSRTQRQLSVRRGMISSDAPKREYSREQKQYAQDISNVQSSKIRIPRLPPDKPTFFDKWGFLKNITFNWRIFAGPTATPAKVNRALSQNIYVPASGKEYLTLADVKERREARAETWKQIEEEGRERQKANRKYMDDLAAANRKITLEKKKREADLQNLTGWERWFNEQDRKYYEEAVSRNRLMQELDKIQEYEERRKQLESQGIDTSEFPDAGSFIVGGGGFGGLGGGTDWSSTIVTIALIGGGAWVLSNLGKKR